MSLSKLTVPYKNKKNGDVISPTEWNSNMKEIENIINANVNSLTFNDDDVTSGANSIGAKAPAGLVGETVQEVLEALKEYIDEQSYETSGITMAELEAYLQNTVLPGKFDKIINYIDEEHSSRFALQSNVNTAISNLTNTKTDKTYVDEKDALKLDKAIFANTVPSKIYIQPTEPTNAANGDIWIQIV